MNRTLQRILATSALALPLVLAGCAHPPPPPPPPMPPPPAYTDPGQLGFHDGYDAARRDIASNRPPGPDRHPRFRNPPVPPPAWEEYRRAFREGYQRALHPEPPPPPGQ